MMVIVRGKWFELLEPGMNKIMEVYFPTEEQIEKRRVEKAEAKLAFIEAVEILEGFDK